MLFFVAISLHCIRVFIWIMQYCKNNILTSRRKDIFYRLLILSFYFIGQFTLRAQVSGLITDAKTFLPVQYASIVVMNVKDSSFVKGEVTDSAGSFIIESLSSGNYYLKISFIGYETILTEPFLISNVQPAKHFGTIKLKASAEVLKGAVVEAKQVMVQQKEDTIQYNANAFKTHPDATAEDLVAKMPGITTDNGSVKAHGEDVKQILVDGKPFFGDDPNAALKNLPADVIEKIQVFDKLSDQAQFTGFDDGQSNKTINIVTKLGKNNGQFGKIYAGYGEDDRYIAGGNINLFNGDRRISVIGLSNNINQQNFSTQDLLGVTGSGGRGGGRGGYGGGQYGGGQGGNSSYNFLVNPQNGISTTNAVGLNYSDKWGSKIKVSGSYFFNEMDNINTGTLTRNYITSKNTGQRYYENDNAENLNYNHRVNFRFEYTIDTANSLIITPKLNFQDNNAISSVFGNNRLPENVELSKTTNSTKANNAGYDLSNNILFRHKFTKRGRTFSLGLSNGMNYKTGTGSVFSLSKYYFTNDSTFTDQHSNQNTNGYSISPNIVYTEPLDSSSQLQFSYNPSYISNMTDKEVNNFNYTDQIYSNLDTALSNKYESTYIANKGGLGYRRNNKKYNFMAGFNYQYATLSGSEHFPTSFMVSKSFSNILPQAMLNYKFSRGTNLRIIYRTSTNMPSVSQLQNVINNSNPLLLSTGNPDLKQDFEHTVTIRYGKTNAEKASGLFVLIYANYAQNYIGNSTLIPVKDTTLTDGTLLKRGSQLTKPVNLDAYWNTRSLITYAWPVVKIKCNVNFNTGFNYTQTPGSINSAINLANNYGLSGGAGLSSNISEKLDFSVSYTANYNIVKNTLQTQSNSNYFSQVTSLKFNWIFWKGIVFNTSVNHTLYNGLSQSYNQDFLFWNASLGYKLLKDHSLEIKASVFDILKQNNSISRTVTETYIEDSQTRVLTRYFMFTLTYTLRNFKK